MGDVDFWEVMDVMVYVANSRKNNANKNIHFYLWNIFGAVIWRCFLSFRLYQLIKFSRLSLKFISRFLTIWLSDGYLFKSVLPSAALMVPTSMLGISKPS